MNVASPGQDTASWEKVSIFVFGVVFVVILLVIAVSIPNPTEFQFFVFRVVLALVAAAIAALVPGFLNIQSQVYRSRLRAGGAVAVFVIVYLINPPKIINAVPSRVITEDKSETFKRALRQSSGTITIIPAGTSADVLPLATQLCGLAKTAGWTTNCIGILGESPFIGFGHPYDVHGLKCYSRSWADASGKAFESAMDNAGLKCDYVIGNYATKEIEFNFITVLVGS
jgi:hypothetical protein